MKKEYFNIDNYGEIYNNIDYLNPNDLKKHKWRQYIFSFYKRKLRTSLNSVAAIDGKIYNF